MVDCGLLRADLYDVSVPHVLLFPSTIDLQKVVILFLRLEQILWRRITLTCLGLALLLTIELLSTIAVNDKDDALLFCRITEKPAEVALDELLLVHFVDHFLERTISYVLLRVKDAGEELERRAGQARIRYLTQQSFLSQSIADECTFDLIFVICGCMQIELLKVLQLLR